MKYFEFSIIEIQEQCFLFVAEIVTFIPRLHSEKAEGEKSKNFVNE
jgi:hypothetical protein